jgi:hypothetical protein
MKKLLATALLAVAFVTPSKAQFKFGLQAGLNLSSVSTKNYSDDIESRTGFFAGPTVKYTLPTIGIGFDASIFYDHREGNSKWGTVKAQSVQIPINLRYGFDLSNLTELFIFAGPQFGIVVEDGYYLSSLRTVSINSSNYSANIGVGATFMNHFQAKFNYNIALSETGDFEAKSDYNVPSKPAGSFKINTWQISVAYFF